MEKGSKCYHCGSHIDICLWLEYHNIKPTPADIFEILKEGMHDEKVIEWLMGDCNYFLENEEFLQEMKNIVSKRGR